MKNLRILTIIISIIAVSCNVTGQDHRTVRGNHHVTKSERTTGNFTGIKVSSGIDVYLSQGNSQSLTVEADENLHEYIKTEVRGNVLHVYSDANIREAECEKVYVTIPEIRSVETTSAGDVVGQTPVTSDRLDLSASSAGDIQLEVHTGELSINISSSGDMTLKGETDKLQADLSSAGDLKAFDLTARNADLEVSSAGDANITVTEKLTARASSAGDIDYKGDPKYIDAHTSSAGGIHKR